MDSIPFEDLPPFGWFSQASQVLITINPPKYGFFGFPADSNQLDNLTLTSYDGKS